MKTKSVELSLKARSVWSALGLVILFWFTYDTFAKYLIPGIVEIFNLSPETNAFSHLELLGIPFIWHILTSIIVCLALNIFIPLKAWKEDGLVHGLALGFALNIGAAFVFGLDVGLICGLAFGLVYGLLGEFEISTVS